EKLHQNSAFGGMRSLVEDDPTTTQKSDRQVRVAPDYSGTGSGESQFRSEAIHSRDFGSSCIGRA
ncbi:MAG: hypothetical protein P8Z33_14355, partial [Gammaproteobacteria bacterium]